MQSFPNRWTFRPIDYTDLSGQFREQPNRRGDAELVVHEKRSLQSSAGLFFIRAARREVLCKGQIAVRFNTPSSVMYGCLTASAIVATEIPRLTATLNSPDVRSRHSPLPKKHPQKQAKQLFQSHHNKLKNCIYHGIGRICIIIT